ncbi:hypothetical protein GJAV_G00136670 [Gymnothorax javanicus]|nr:hypothetical protein GJAV_G00136670 [Gymnothorax javanicus]
MQHRAVWVDRTRMVRGPPQPLAPAGHPPKKYAAESPTSKSWIDFLKQRLNCLCHGFTLADPGSSSQL